MSDLLPEIPQHYILKKCILYFFESKGIKRPCIFRDSKCNPNVYYEDSVASFNLELFDLHRLRIVLFRKSLIKLVP